MADKKKTLAEMIRGSVGDASIAAMDAQAVPESGTGREQITYIPRTALFADEKNFYSIEGIDELAANIETVGLLDPLRVRPIEGEDGLYRIVSGHRRRAALDKLALEGCTRFEQVPVIIEHDAASPALQELRLIFANNDTRRLSSADTAKQAERVEMLLYELKEEGYDFPGRMIEHVAEACKVSRTRIGTLKKIKADLIPEWREKWERGECNESKALALARQTPERQKMFFEAFGDKPEYALYENMVEHYAKTMDVIDSLECRHDGCTGECANRANMCRATLAHYAYEDSCRTCCAECSELVRCKYHCPRLNDEIKERKAKLAAEKDAAEKERAEAAKKAADERAAREAERESFVRKSWMHFGAAVKGAGLSTQDAFELLGFSHPDEDDLASMEISFRGDAPDKDRYYQFGDEPFCDSDLDKIRAAADRLGCSLDYLLCRTDEPGGVPESGTDSAPQWRTGTPPASGKYWCTFEIEGHLLDLPAVWDDIIGRWEHENGVGIGITCRAWYPLPADIEEDEA